MSAQALGYQLPEIYRKLLPKELLKAEIHETKATCGSCNWSAYQPNLKCCTYEPYLPNFLVGSLFESAATAPLALQALRTKIEKRQFSLPIGMTASVRYQVEFNQRDEKDFGNRADWLCPYYNQAQQNCGIWKNRGAVCTTFFCQSSYDVMGQEFWKQMNDYLTYVEMAVMEEVLVHLDFSPRQISECLQYLNRQEGSATELKSHGLPEAKARKLWNGYYDEQEDFFRQTYKMAQSLTPKNFREAIGELGEEIEGSLLESLQELQTMTPARSS
jgi:Fe-S-cluster containining protein